MQIKTYTKCVFPNLDTRPSEPCCSGMHPKVPCWGTGGVGEDLRCLFSRQESKY